MEEENAIAGGGRRRRVIAGLVVCVLVGTIVVALWPTPKEPEYNGKKLSEWVEIYAQGLGKKDISLQGEAIQAIQAMGTNALRCSLRWGQLHPTDWQLNVAVQCRRFGFRSPQHWANERVRKHAYGWLTMRALGTKARPAIPEVCQIALKSRVLSVVSQAVEFLGANGPESVPALLEIIKKGNEDSRRYAVRSIGLTPDLGTNEPAVVEVLLKCLDEYDQLVQENAALSLSLIALKDRRVIALLTERLRSPHSMVSYYAGCALMNLATNRETIPELSEAVRELTKAQQDPSPMLRELATNVLLKIASEGLTNSSLHATQ